MALRRLDMERYYQFGDNLTVVDANDDKRYDGTHGDYVLLRSGNGDLVRTNANDDDVRFILSALRISNPLGSIRHLPSALRYAKRMFHSVQMARQRDFWMTAMTLKSALFAAEKAGLDFDNNFAKGLLLLSLRDCDKNPSCAAHQQFFQDAAYPFIER